METMQSAHRISDTDRTYNIAELPYRLWWVHKFSHLGMVRITWPPLFVYRSSN